MSTTIIISLLVIHYIADYLFQTRRQGNGKASSLYLLGEHVFTYMNVFGIGLCLMMVTGIAPNIVPDIWIFMCITFLLHFVTDFVTSKATKKLWAQKKEYATFAVMGLDQLLHTTGLVITWQLIFQ